MPDELPYMRLWVGDLLADPAVWEMDSEEFGVYMKLLCIAWRKGSIPAAAKARAKIVRLSLPKFEAAWESMADKWISDGNGGLVNPRQERERTEAVDLHQKRKAAGAKGGKAKGKRS